MSDQNELIEQYLLDCRRNPNAPVPAGLDPDMAAFIRQVAKTRPRAQEAAARQRVWQKAWSDSAAGRQQILHPDFSGAETMETTVIPNRRTRTARAGVWGLVATLALVLVVTFTGWRLAVQYASQPTVTPTMTLTPTATPHTPTLVPTVTDMPPTVPPPGFGAGTSTPLPVNGTVVFPPPTIVR